MHSRIFQVTKEKQDKENWISESDYYDCWFVGEIADYVSDDVDREDSIKWLANATGGVLSVEGDVVTIVGKEKYFESKFAEFNEQLNRLTKINVKQFAGDEASDVDIAVYRFKAAYDDRYGFYVDDGGEYGGLITFDEFMRHSKNGETYYIGGVVDYHS